MSKVKTGSSRSHPVERLQC